MTIDLLTLVINEASFLVLCFMVGVFVLKLTMWSDRTAEFALNKPATTIGVGLALVTLVSFLTGMWSTTLYPVLLFASLGALALILDILNRGDHHIVNKMNLISYPVLLLTLSWFSFAIFKMGWPPPGDIMSSIGPTSSVILLNGRLPVAPSPLLILYPPGFTMLTAIFASAWQTFPAYSILIIGALLCSLAPALLFEITCTSTKSYFLSILAALSAFFIPYTRGTWQYGSVDLETWLYGYFFNGPYPNLEAFILILATSSTLTEYYYVARLRAHGFFEVMTIIGLILCALLVEYPPYAILLALVMGMLLINRLWSLARSHDPDSFLNKRNTSYMQRRALGIALLISLALLLSTPLLSQPRVLIGYLTAQYSLDRPNSLDVTYNAYSLSWNIVMSDPYTYIILAGLAFYCINSAKRKTLNCSVGLLLSVAFTLIASSLIPSLRYYLSFVVPKRTLLISGIIAVPVLLQESREVSICWFRKLSRRLPSTETKLLVLICLAVSGYLLVSPYLDGTLMTRYAWFNIDASLPMLKWANMNIPKQALVLNDGSYTSEFLLSMSFHNLTNWYWTRTLKPQQVMQTQEVILNPSNYLDNYVILSRYNVSYIMTTSELGHLVLDQDGVKYDPKINLQALASCPYLQLVYGEGDNRVYKVRQNFEK